MPRLASFVWAALLCLPPVVEADYLQVDRKAPVRREATSSSERLGDVAVGERLPLLDDGAQDKGYYHVQFGEQEGWIYRTSVRRFRGDIPPSPPAVAGAAGTTAGGSAAVKGRFVPGCALPYKDIAGTDLSIDKVCAIDGEGSDGTVSQNRVKNNLCAVGPSVVLQIADFDTLQTAADRIVANGDFVLGSRLKTDRSPLGKPVKVSRGSVHEGSLVTLAAFIIQGHYSNVGTGENVNCNVGKQVNNDIHTAVGAESELDECESITIEMTPHLRPSAWTPDNLNRIRRPVRVSGQLMFDASHGPCRGSKRASPARRSTWEIHPVYALDVCRARTLAQCDAIDESKWVPFHEWIGTEVDESD